MPECLKILTIGAGAIGTYIGGSLALAGHRVVFLEREGVAEHIRADGLTLKINDQIRKIPAPEIVSSMNIILQSNHFDFVIFALKSFDTESFIRTVSPFSATLPPILCLSNGVDNEPILAQSLGWDRVITGTVTSAVSRQNAGNITLERLRGVGIAAGHPLSKKITTEMDLAGLKARLISSAADMKWSKLLTNLIANASSAILNLSPAEVYAHPKLFRFEIMQLRETLAVMRSQGIKVINLPGTPVQLLALAVQFLPLRWAQSFLQKAVIGGRGEKMPSLFLDLHSGRGKSEVDYLNGAVVRAGKKRQIPTPVNQFLSETLMGLTTGKIDLKTYQKQPEKFISHFSASLPKPQN